MGLVFVLGVAGRFELEGGVRDVEVADQALLQLVQQPGHVPVVEAAVVDDDVSGEDGQRCRDSGGVQVVDVLDVGHFE